MTTPTLADGQQHRCAADDGMDPHANGSLSPAASSTAEDPKSSGESQRDGSNPGTNAAVVGGTGVKALPTNAASTSPDVSPELRTRLRKLERFEKSYPELLASYRIAHKRVLTIDKFETVLKENTPLTSIEDPDALIEFLSQHTSKSAMTMDELRRVSAERDGYRADAQALKDEVAALRATTTTTATHNAAEHPPGEETKGHETGRRGGEDDFFSYDKEVPQLQAHLDAKTSEIVRLRADVRSLTEKLDLAQEHSAELAKKLETATRDIHELRENNELLVTKDGQLEARDNEIAALTSRLRQTQGQIHEHVALFEAQRTEAAAASKDLKSNLNAANMRASKLESEISQVAEARTLMDGKIAGLMGEIESLQVAKIADEAKIDELSTKLKLMPPVPAAAASQAASGTAILPGPSSAQGAGAAGGPKKRNKRKKKGGAAAPPAVPELTPSETSTDQPTPSPDESPARAQLEMEIARLREEILDKDERISKLSRQRKTEEDLREDVESLRENLLTIGSDHVEAKEMIKNLEAEKKALQTRIAETEAKMEGSAAAAAANLAKVEAEYENLKHDFRLKTVTLKSDLAASEQLAKNRYRELSTIKNILSQVEPELRTLRSESAALKTMREELAAQAAELRTMEQREKELKTEVTRLQQLTADQKVEIKALHDRIAIETTSRQKAEDEQRRTAKDLRRAEAEMIKLSASEEKATGELRQLREEMSKNLRPRVRELEDSLAKQDQETTRLRGETELKSRQYASAQELIGSMRDQTNELKIQVRECKEAAGELDDQLAEARRMLDERSRECITIRRLLHDADAKADARVLDMKAQLDQAVEERDRFEAETGTAARRRAREAEEQRQRVKELEQEVQALRVSKGAVETELQGWRQRQDELEAEGDKGAAELEEMRTTANSLQTALTKAEDQARNAEQDVADLRQKLEERRMRHEKLMREHKALQAKLASSRKGSSTPSPGATVLSPPAASAEPDLMYLKTILLQFLEKRDNQVRAQLVPVLGKLLKFDKGDEQKWHVAVERMGTK